ncbi:MAG: hypothetical protein WAV93_09340 [Bacteroidales bacterium]
MIKKIILALLMVTATFTACTMFLDCIGGNGEFETEVRDAVPCTAIANETSFSCELRIWF